MKFILGTIDLIYEKVTKKDWDGCYGITGEEGVSKSNLGLHLIDRWYQNLYGNCTKNDIRHISLEKEGFVSDLKNLKKYEATDYDEAGELSNKRTMAKFNFLINQTYQVIRGDNLFTILTIPSVFDLDPFFAKRRLRGLFVVYKRGCVAFYSRKRLRKIMELNQNRYVKRINIVNPTWRDTFPIYKGVLKEPYEIKKKEKTKLIRQKLYESVVADDKKDLAAIAIYNMHEAGFKQSEIQKYFNFWTKPTISRKIKKQCQIQEKTYT